MKEAKLTLYAVRSRDGQWFRSKGYSGSGENWVEELDQARIYTKIGHARSQVTYYASKFPSFGVPEIVVLKITEMEVIDETERFLKLQKKKDKALGIKRMPRK